MSVEGLIKAIEDYIVKKEETLFRTPFSCKLLQIKAY